MGVPYKVIVMLQTKDNDINIKTASKILLTSIMRDKLCWEDVSCFDKDCVGFEGSGNLCGGQSEQEAHNEIVKTIKENSILVNYISKITTELTNMGEIPANTYEDLV